MTFAFATSRTALARRCNEGEAAVADPECRAALREARERFFERRP